MLSTHKALWICVGEWKSTWLNRNFRKIETFVKSGFVIIEVWLCSHAWCVTYRNQAIPSRTRRRPRTGMFRKQFIYLRRRRRGVLWRGPRDLLLSEALIIAYLLNTYYATASRRGVSSRGMFVGTGVDSKNHATLLEPAWNPSFLYVPFPDIRKTQPTYLLAHPADGVRDVPSLLPPTGVNLNRALRGQPLRLALYCPTHIRPTAFFCSLSRMKLRKKNIFCKAIAVSRWRSPSPNIRCRCSKRHVPLYWLITCLK